MAEASLQSHLTSGKSQIVGNSTRFVGNMLPACAGLRSLAAGGSNLRDSRPDVLFLDIEMPGMSGFDLLEKLGDPQPLVVFTTAYDRYALDAFKVNSIGYLLNPVGSTELRRALNKVERVLGGIEERGDMGSLLRQVRTILGNREREFLVRVASRVGDHVEFIEVAQVSHLYAKDKLTFAATATKHHPLDLTISDLEEKFPPRLWVRIHRSPLLNIHAVKELHSSFAGKLIVRLKDGHTELNVARERAPEDFTQGVITRILTLLDEPGRIVTLVIWASKSFK